MLVLIDNERSADQPTLDVESNISLETETEEPDKMSRKKVSAKICSIDRSPLVKSLVDL